MTKTLSMVSHKNHNIIGNESEDIYWILDHESELHSIWDL